MKKVLLVLALLLFCVSVPIVSSAVERSPLRVGIGACYIGGTPGAAIDMLSEFGVKGLYLRVGLGYTDTKSLSIGTDKEDRKFTPLYIDAVYYLYEDTYIGGGLNYPVKVSDKDTGNFGVDLYVGMENNIGIPAKLITEIGYSSLRRMDKAAFEGLWLMVGLRFDLVPASAAPAAVTPPAPAPAPEVVPAPAPEVAPVASPETVKKATPEQIANLNAVITVLEAELVKEQDYVKVLDQKIESVKAAGGDKTKLAGLDSLRTDAEQRVWIIQAKLDDKKAQKQMLQQ